MRNIPSWITPKSGLECPPVYGFKAVLKSGHCTKSDKFNYFRWAFSSQQLTSKRGAKQ